jgi:hypothetical protein
VNLEPPSGSGISVTTDGAYPLIVVPHRSSGPMRFFHGLFLLVLLGAWFAGFSDAVSKLLSGQVTASLNCPRYAACLGSPAAIVAWTLVAAFAAYWAYRALRPSVPESLRLMPNSVIYDSGIPPFQASAISRADFWKSMFQKRTRTELDWQKLQSLRLIKTNDGNWLTVDVDGFNVFGSRSVRCTVRLDIAQSAAEIEREWLYQLLAKRYSLPLPQRNTLADRGSG